jgi:hypothetical protein
MVVLRQSFDNLVRLHADGAQLVRPTPRPSTQRYAVELPAPREASPHPFFPILPERSEAVRPYSAVSSNRWLGCPGDLACMSYPTYTEHG